MLYDYKKWRGFPRIAYDENGVDCTTVRIEFKHEELEVGDTLRWTGKHGKESVEFVVDQIRLNPTPRVYSEKTGAYYLLINCVKIAEKEITKERAEYRLFDLAARISTTKWYEFRKRARLHNKAETLAKRFGIKY